MVNQIHSVTRFKLRKYKMKLRMVLAYFVKATVKVDGLILIAFPSSHALSTPQERSPG